MAKKVDWAAIRDDYLQHKGTQAQLAERYGVSAKTLAHHCIAEKWTAMRREADRAAAAEAVVTAAGSAIEYQTRIHKAAMQLLGRVEEYLAASAGDRKLKSTDLLNLSRALQAIKDVADVRSPGDMAEQAARIDKLRADAKRDDDKGEEIRVELTPEAEEYAG